MQPDANSEFFTLADLAVQPELQTQRHAHRVARIVEADEEAVPALVQNPGVGDLGEALLENFIVSRHVAHVGRCPEALLAVPPIRRDR